MKAGYLNTQSKQVNGLTFTETIHKQRFYKNIIMNLPNGDNSKYNR